MITGHLKYYEEKSSEVRKRNICNDSFTPQPHSFTSPRVHEKWNFLRFFFFVWLLQTSGELKGWEQPVHSDSMTRRPIKSHRCCFEAAGHRQTDTLGTKQHTQVKTSQHSLKRNYTSRTSLSLWCLALSVRCFVIKATIYIWYFALASVTSLSS